MIPSLVTVDIDGDKFLCVAIKNSSSSDWLSQLTTADGEQLQFDPSLLEEDNNKDDKR